MLVPSVSSLTYIPPARSPALRAVGAAAPVAEPRARIGERELSADEERILQQMRSRDRELRVQERAYVLLGGTLLRTLPSHTYERGPDGRFYAIAAEATIDTSSVGMLDQDIAAAQAMFAADPLPVKAAASRAGRDPGRDRTRHHRFRRRDRRARWRASTFRSRAVRSARPP
ncbi:MAG: hypothetical protein MZW92_01495 [Comamonadaceae bacterium]|nr:hypothetical protein [Comamonadaceae bacterium]